MRASRLLHILTLLQARSRMTATDLAEACEVSVRTIYRDIDALSAGGVPVYGEKGEGGGYRLLDGYRVRLNGLSPLEAEALFLSGLAGPAADLGLGPVVAMAEAKLLAALPEDLRQSADRVRARFLLDAPAWFERIEQVPHLPRIADTVWSQRRIHIHYRSWKGERERTVDPLGIVLKAGAWYLAAAVADSVRTYRIARIDKLKETEETFDRPKGFDLGAYWAEATERLEAELHAETATVRLSPEGLRLLNRIALPVVREGTRLVGSPDENGWQTALMPAGTDHEGLVDLLRFGAEIEVIAPKSLRDKITAMARALGVLYADTPDA